MKRHNITADTMPLVGKKWKEIASKINTGNLSILDTITDTSCRFKTYKYIEDGTNEIRNVNVLEVGLPVQLCVHFYA